MWVARFKHWAQLQCLHNDKSLVRWRIGLFVLHLTAFSVTTDNCNNDIQNMAVSVSGAFEQTAL